MARTICVILFVLYVFQQFIYTVSKNSTINNIDLSTTNFDDEYIVKSIRKIPYTNNILSVFKNVMRNYTMKKVFKPTQCVTDLDFVFQGVYQKQIWALKMIDASSVIQPGLLEGNLVDFGQFDECVKIGTSKTPADIQAQHCLLSITVHLNGSVDILPQEVSEALGSGITLTFALCLPRSCSTEEIQSALNEVSTFANKEISGGNNISMNVNPGDCQFKEDIPISVLEWCALSTCFILLGLMILSTGYDVLTENNRLTRCGDIMTKDKLLISFSVLTNGRKLFNTSMPPESFPVLNCLKVVGIFWVIIGHKYRFSAEYAIINLIELPDYLKRMRNMLILNSQLSVDIFFLVSALLVTYGYLKFGSSKRVTVTSHLTNIIYRYLRLTPAYALMILITTTWLYRMGDGPLWKRIVGDAKQCCEDYWWSGLLYINNYYNPDYSCMMQSWYLAADMQLYLFAPIVLYPLLKWPRWGLVLLAICTVFSVAIPLSVAYVQEIKTPLAISKDTDRVRRETDALYLPTHTRSVSYIIGILVGYILFQIRVRKVEFRLKKHTNILFWLIAITLLLLSLFGCYPFYQISTPYNKWASSLYIGLFRLGWSLGIGWIIIACSTGHGGFVNTFSSWSLFVPLGRLTYCVYLVHVAVMYLDIGCMRIPMYFNNYPILYNCFGVYVMSLLLSVVLTLAMESPLMVIQKIILQRDTSVKPTDINLPRSILPRILGTSRRIRQGHDY